MRMQPGVYDEEGLKRFDLTLARAAAWNIKIIYTFVDYWSGLGGMQWYVRGSPRFLAVKVQMMWPTHSMGQK